MIPGKSFKPDDFVEIAWRRRWMIVAPLVVSAIGMFSYAQTLPNMYRSEAEILVIPPRVPEAFVKSTVTTRLDERLNSMTERIMSRTQLERIIQEFNLYPEERKALLLEDVVAKMQDKFVKVAVAKPKGRKAEPNHFTVSFESTNPKTAMVVTERIASLFVNTNLEERGLQADSTSEFLQSQVEDAHKRLTDLEKQLETYKKLHSGELPTQQQANVHVMQTTQAQLQQLVDSVNRDRDCKLLLEGQLADEESRVVQPPSVKSEDLKNASASTQLDAARATLRDMELRLTPEHPDVVHQKRIIADLQKKVDAEAMQAPLGDRGAPRIVTSTEAQRLTKLTQLRTEIQAIERRLTWSQAEQTRLQGIISSSRSRIEAAPIREAELTQMMREYEVVQATYTSLLKKSEDSAMAANIERRQIGEQFRIVDSARMPERPSSPDRLRLSLMGIAAGLVLGLGLAVLLEYRDTTVRSEEDVLLALALPVVALIPSLTTAAERRSRRRRAWLASSAGVFVVVAAAALIWKLKLLQVWGR